MMLAVYRYDTYANLFIAISIQVPELRHDGKPGVSTVLEHWSPGRTQTVKTLGTTDTKKHTNRRERNRTFRTIATNQTVKMLA